ncbi:copper transporter [Corynebacterium choanae]|uniref:Copper transporter MctB n=1 Tax=Corynebacterium choanae TaxID=1862358 RepID=A0A3G6J5Z2_9CORY|nr:copper transporter [Corynebacterium choanae]AZA13487.1 Copper transporter MctB precursor [Corynebacterium choanae]
MQPQRNTSHGLATSIGIIIGLVAGTAVLAPAIPGFTTFAQRATATQDAQQQRATALQARIDHAEAAAANAWITDIALAHVTGTLTGVEIVILATADASDNNITAIRGLIEQAGGRISGELTLTAQIHDETTNTQLTTLLNRLTPPTNPNTPPTNPNTPPGQPTTQLGATLGAALQQQPATGETTLNEPDRTLLFEGLRQAGLITYNEPPQPGRAAILITGDTPQDPTTPTEQRQPRPIVEIAQGFVTTAPALVVAGGIRAAADTGIIGMLRTSNTPGLTTVDSISYAYAQIAAIFALRQELAGQSGAYGAAANAQAAAPTQPIGPPPQPDK